MCIIIIDTLLLITVLVVLVLLVLVLLISCSIIIISIIQGFQLRKTGKNYLGHAGNKTASTASQWSPLVFRANH